jgi:hypothetical protein
MRAVQPSNPRMTNSHELRMVSERGTPLRASATALDAALAEMALMEIRLSRKDRKNIF